MTTNSRLGETLLLERRYCWRDATTYGNHLEMPDVSNVVKSIQDIMRKDARNYGDAQRLEQLGWMFFLKIFDERTIQECFAGIKKSICHISCA